MSDLPSHVEPDFGGDEETFLSEMRNASYRHTENISAHTCDNRVLQTLRIHGQRLPDPSPVDENDSQATSDRASSENSYEENTEDSLDSGMSSLTQDVATSQANIADITGGIQNITLRKELVNINIDNEDEEHLSLPLQETGIWEQNFMSNIEYQKQFPKHVATSPQQQKQQQQQQKRQQKQKQQHNQQQNWHQPKTSNQVSVTQPHNSQSYSMSLATRETQLQHKIHIHDTPQTFLVRPPPDNKSGNLDQSYQEICVGGTNGGAMHNFNAHTRFSAFSHFTPYNPPTITHTRLHTCSSLRVTHPYRSDRGDCVRGDRLREDCVWCTSLEGSREESGFSSGLPTTPSKEQVILAFGQDEDGDTQLHIAIILCLVQEASLFISWAPKHHFLNISNSLGQTPLHLAVLMELPSLVRRLMTAGAIVESYDHHGNTPLHLACRSGHVQCIHMLTTPVTYREASKNEYTIPYQKIPQELDLLNYEGQSGLHLAASRGHVGVVDYLISLGADINVKDGKSGRTILHHAVEMRDIELLYYLLNHPDINLNARTYDGSSPLALAMGRGYQDVATLLVNNGARYAQWYNVGDDDDDEEEDNSSSDEAGSDLDDLLVNGQPIRAAGEGYSW